ncbi:hypothetical protein J7426_03510 [Tropicibacter sp. R16_0]|uniref:YciI family protein n=1 Tax=Tropicibacter sp. R16_0 TaxID=2821102 RepID=UPI001ADB2705|nr:YciI family protein [Tropicibacter sp. R16_0]MBO9449309.1 hypothetical protein [Tropicibacter sp. R16_0]
MLYCVTFQDNSGKEHLRQEHMADHLAFLATLGPKMIGAGPLFDGQDGQGGMWLVEADSAADVQSLVEQDPFWPTGLRKSVSVLEWRQVFRDGQRT